MPGPESTAAKSTAPKKSRSFNLFGRRKKKEEKAPAAQQQEQNVSPPSAGRKRRNALTPAQAREAQEMLKRQRELEQAKLAHNVMLKRSWFADQMRQREKEKEEEQERERAEKEKVKAEHAHNVMVMRSRFEDQQKFKEISESAKTDFEQVKTKSDEIKGITHTGSVGIQMQSLKETMAGAEKKLAILQGAKSELYKWRGSEFEPVVKELEDKKKSAEEAKAAAEGRIARSTEARARFEKHAKSKKVMKLIRKIASLHSGGAGNNVFEMLPQDVQANRNPPAPPNGNPPVRQQAPSTKEKAKAFFSRLWEFFTNFKEDLQGAADNINGIVADCFDFADLKAGSIGTGTIGAANSFFWRHSQCDRRLEGIFQNVRRGCGPKNTECPEEC